MVHVMSKENAPDKRSKERKEVDEWMYGSGSKVMGGIIILLCAYFVLTIFI